MGQKRKVDLVGKVVGVSWQDIWWSTDERSINNPWEDEEFIHFTYGLVLRDDREFISVTHEWRPERQRYAGTTSIPKKVIRSLKVYGDGSIEAASEEGDGAGSAAPGGRSKAKHRVRRSSKS